MKFSLRITKDYVSSDFLVGEYSVCRSFFFVASIAEYDLCSNLFGAEGNNKLSWAPSNDFVCKVFRSVTLRSFFLCSCDSWNFSISNFSKLLYSSYKI
jgi:hypothetical protein